VENKMKYEPNFNDPRVLNRIRHAYGFARAVINGKPHRWSTRFIDKFFGHQGNDLSKWLRNQLLICTSHKYSDSSGLTKEYKLNEAGADYIRDVLQGRRDLVDNSTTIDIEFAHIENRQFDKEVVARFIQKEWGDELTNKTFTYADKSSRLFHPLQNVRKLERQRAFADYDLCYQYDIECAAPTLLHQHAQRQEDPMDLYLFALRKYLRNRQEIRKNLAKDLDIDEKTAKVIINALFCGARVGLGNDFAISQLLDNDPARVIALKEHEYIYELREDIKTCWTYIYPSMTRRSIKDKKNRERLLPVSSKEKWMRYFDLERTCLNAVRTYLDKTNNKYFLEHDGWTCQQLIDINALTEFVFNTTGYQLKFELTKTFTGLKRREKLSELVE
jgi:hypothetical protein